MEINNLYIPSQTGDVLCTMALILAVFFTVFLLAVLLLVLAAVTCKRRKNPNRGWKSRPKSVLPDADRSVLMWRADEPEKAEQENVMSYQGRS